MRHSGAGQPIVRSEKQMVANGKANNSVSNSGYRWKNRGFANSRNVTDQRIEVLKGIQSRFYLMEEKMSIFSIRSGFVYSMEMVC